MFCLDFSGNSFSTSMSMAFYYQRSHCRRIFQLPVAGDANADSVRYRFEVSHLGPPSYIVHHTTAIAHSLCLNGSMATPRAFGWVL